MTRYIDETCIASEKSGNQLLVGSVQYAAYRTPGPQRLVAQSEAREASQIRLLESEVHVVG